MQLTKGMVVRLAAAAPLLTVALWQGSDQGSCEGISGTVRAEGRPLAGAIVAARTRANDMLPPAGPPSAGRTRTDATGAYCLVLPSGRYDVSVVTAAARLKSAVTSVVDANPGATASVELERGGGLLRGVLRHNDGQLASSSEIRALRLPSGEIFYGESVEEGGYALNLPEGTYRVYAANATHAAAPVDVTVIAKEATAPVEVVLLPGWAHGPAPEVVIGALRANAYPLSTTDPAASTADLEPVGRLLAGARIVGAGEASHGTREFFQVKHRLFRHLVEHHGFTTLAMEAPVAEALDVDEYVRTGRGDPAAALGGLYAWTWQTEEILELIQWMRAWNADARHEVKLRFRGFDMQSPVRATLQSLAYVATVNSSAAAAALAALAPLTDPFLLDRFRRTATPSDMTRLDSAAQLFVATLDSMRVPWSAATGESQWHTARGLARVVAQFTASLDDPDEIGNLRDRFMAENLLRLLEEPGARGGIFAWAHNDHVTRDSTAYVRRMGAHLSAALGEGYMNVGFAFSSGSFVAVEGLTGLLPLRAFDVPPLGPETLDAALLRSGYPLATFDLRKLDAPAEVATWFAAPHGTHDIQAAYSTELNGKYFQSAPVRRRFDLLTFVARTTAARGLPHQIRQLSSPIGPPRHLDFAGTEADVLAHWGLATRIDYAGVRSSVDRCEGTPLSHCLTLARRPGPHYGERMGRAMQRIDATPFRGKTAAFRVSAYWTADGRDLLGREGSARLFVRTVGSQQGAARDTIVSAGWNNYVFDVAIPPKARAIEIGVALSGPGRVQIGGVALTPH